MFAAGVDEATAVHMLTECAQLCAWSMSWGSLPSGGEKAEEKTASPTMLR